MGIKQYHIVSTPDFPTEPENPRGLWIGFGGQLPK
jgi:hypothetical protein